MQTDTLKETNRDKESHRERKRCTDRDITEREKKDLVEYLNLVTSEINLTPGILII